MYGSYFLVFLCGFNLALALMLLLRLWVFM